jgi:hypothetical protein
MISPDNAKDCLNFLQEWCDLRKCDLDQNEDLACEKMATTAALNNIDTLEARGLLIRIVCGKCFWNQLNPYR